ncbi:MAG: tetratricopeptide repeat protein, partial [bacterium]|nr:tetratricopeptide repeat protein [bacterium]
MNPEIHHHILRLELSREQIDTLKKNYREISQAVDNHTPLPGTGADQLKKTLSRAVAAQPGWRYLMERIHAGGDYYCLHLLHQDNFILNLPWGMAADPVSGKPLESLQQLFLCGGIAEYYSAEPGVFSTPPAPLKVLVMIASPEPRDGRGRATPMAADGQKRLSYEQEEELILDAFEPLRVSGEVEVHFTENGSLDALREKLLKNHYHILHVTGHATFNEEKRMGFLELEDPLHMQAQSVSSADFADAVNCNPDFRVPMVVLSCCRSAVGGKEKNFGGLTDMLHKKGVPVVVSMGMSIADSYAAVFSARLYTLLAQKQSIYRAFTEARAHLRQAESQDLARARSGAMPLQWFIPQLYVSSPIRRIVDWQSTPQTLTPGYGASIFAGRGGKYTDASRPFLFTGRRKVKAALLPLFFAKKAILLTGQGGVGKTAMAEHLVRRLWARYSNVLPFFFDETVVSFAAILELLRDFFRQRRNMDVVAGAEAFDKGMDRFYYYLGHLEKICRPVFIFDNLENFQAAEGGPFLPRHGDLVELMDQLCTGGEFHVILTCRYPVEGVSGLHPFDLHQAGFADFRKRCYDLDVGGVRSRLQRAGQGPGFRDVALRIFEVFGGNYRALEFYDALLRARSGDISEVLGSLRQFEAGTGPQREAAKEQVAENLVFSRLMVLLEVGAGALLVLLARFRVPVRELALRLQLHGGKNKDLDLPRLLEHLRALTLIERSVEPAHKVPYYYVTPIVADLLEQYTQEGPVFDFCHHRAGNYYYDMLNNMGGGLTEMEEAFYHYDESADKERVNELGDGLSDIYYKSYLYAGAFYYASRVYELLGDATGSRVLNNLGLMYKLYGDYDRALDVFRKALEGFRKENNTSAVGTLLNNISAIYKARGDYDTALKYLEQSLRIRRELGDKSGEGTTLNNLATTAYARGDYDTALKYLEQSLSISRELGDKSGEGTTLNNISQIYKARGDYDTALKYLEQSLSIRRELGDKSGEGT